jgi:hypothetical protein
MAKHPKTPNKSEVKAIAPTKATSGEGFNVEDKVAASCAAALLLGRSPFPSLPGLVTRLDFQVAADHWHFNDLLLTMQDTSGAYRAAVSIRSKREITSGGFSTEIKNALLTQHTAPAPNPFDRTRDRLVLAAASHARVVFNAVSTLTRTARGNVALLPTRIEEQGFTNATGRALYADLKEHLLKAGVTAVTPADLLHSFVLEDLEIVALTQAHPPAGLTLCNELLCKPNASTAIALWEALMSACAEQKHANGYLDSHRLLDAVRSRFVLKAYPFDQGDWEIIDTESRGHLDRIIGNIAGYRLARQSSFDAFTASVAANPVTVIVGPSGCGKSSLAKRFVDKVAVDYAVRVWSRASAWTRPQAGTLSLALGLEGLTHGLAELFERVGGPALLVVDGVEYCTDTGRIGQLTRLLQLCRPVDPKSPWRVVLLARMEEWSGVRQQLAIAAQGVKIHTENLEDFTRAELVEISRRFPELRPLVRQPHLESLLRKPKILALVTDHLRAGGALAESTLTGESHLARWFWQDRIRRGDGAALRARAVFALADKQAELVQAEVPEQKFDSALLLAFEELVRDGLCVARNQRIAFQHDLYADWARLEMLIAEGSGWIEFASHRIASPYWHRAVRLYGVWLLEDSPDGASNWAVQVAALSTGEVAARLLADLFLEAPLFSAAPVENLARVWPHLIAGGGELLRRMLGRIRLAASAPNEKMIDLLAQETEISRDHLLSHFRVPYPQYWIPLLRVLHCHSAEAVKLAPFDIAHTAQSWLECSAPDWPGRDDAAELAVLNAEHLVFVTARKPYYTDRDEEKVVYQAAMTAIAEQPTRVATLMRMLAGLIPSDGRKEFPKERWIIHKTGLMPGRGVERKLPPPWAGGPTENPNRSFQDLVLQTKAMVPVMRVDATLTREITLAVCIAAPDIEESYHSSDYGEPQEVVFDRSFEPPFYTRGPFLPLLQTNGREGMLFVLALTNFFSERWVEWAQHRRPGAYTLTVTGENGPEPWLGDHRLYFAHRDAVTCNSFVVSALMALEKWLLDRIEKEDEVDADIEFLLSKSRSLALAGVLISVGKRQPRLLFTKLWPLVASPEIQALEYYCFGMASGASGGIRNSAWERKLAEQWNNLPQHRLQLFDVCRQCLPYPEAQAKLAALSADWKNALKHPDKLTVDQAFLWQLAEFFDPANWKQTHANGGTAWEYHEPEALGKATQARRQGAQGELSLMTVPLECRNLLDKNVALPDEVLEDWFAALDRLPPGPVLDNDGASTIGCLADAQCGIVAVLVHLGTGWLAKSPEKSDRCRKIILHHLKTPPAPRRFMFDDAPFDHTWENFCAEVAPVFLATNPADIEWRTAIGELAGRRHLKTVRILFRRAAAVRMQLGPVFQQMFNLLVWVAAARLVIDITEYEDEKPVQWVSWWPPQLASFVAGTLPEPPSDWETIDLAAPVKVTRHKKRTSATIDIDVVVAGLEWIQSLDQAVSVAERTLWFGWARSMLSSLIATIPRRAGAEGDSPLPYHGEHRALTFLGRLLATISTASDRRTMWEPLLAIGQPASHYIRYFLHAFFTAGLNTLSAEFATAWNEIANWAWTAAAWHGPASSPPHILRELWWTLFLMDDDALLGLTPAHAGFLAAMKPHYEKWAAFDLADPDSAQRFVYLLRNPAAGSLFSDGIQWLDRSLDRDPKHRWRLRHLLRHLSDFVLWAWSNREANLRADADAFAAFKQILMLLAAELDQPALALLSRVTGSSSE